MSVLSLYEAALVETCPDGSFHSGEYSLLRGRSKEPPVSGRDAPSTGTISLANTLPLARSAFEGTFLS